MNVRVAGPAFCLQHVRDSKLRPHMIGRHRQRLLIAVDGFCRAAGVAQSGGEAALHLDVFRLESRAPLVMGDGFVEAVRLLQGGGEIAQRAGILWVERDSALPGGERQS